MAQITVYSSAGDGWIGNFDSDFHNCRNALNGNSADYTSTEAQVQSASQSGYYIKRSFLVFDTSSILDDATITGATLSFYCTSKQDSADNYDLVMLSPTTQASASSLIIEDFDQCVGSVIASNFDIGAITTGAYNDWTITDFTNISKTGNTLIGIKINGDINDSTPQNNNYVNFSTSEQTGTSQDPKLVIDYNPNTTTSTTSSTSTTTTTTSTTTTSTSTTMTTNSTSTTSTTTSTTTTSTSTTSTTSSTSTTTTSTTTTSSSTTTTSSSTTMPFSIAVDNV